VQRLPRDPADRIGREAPAEVHAVAPIVTLDIVRETGGDDGGCRDVVIALHRPGKIGDTRRTSVSAADAEDNGVTVFLDFFP